MMDRFLRSYFWWRHPLKVPVKTLSKVKPDSEVYKSINQTGNCNIEAVNWVSSFIRWICMFSGVPETAPFEAADVRGLSEEWPLTAGESPESWRYAAPGEHGVWAQRLMGHHQRQIQREVSGRELCSALWVCFWALNSAFLPQGNTSWKRLCCFQADSLTLCWLLMIGCAELSHSWLKMCLSVVKKTWSTIWLTSTRYSTSEDICDQCWQNESQWANSKNWVIYILH